MRGSRVALRQRLEPCIEGFNGWRWFVVQAPAKGLLGDEGASVGTFRVWSFQESGAFFWGSA